MKFEKFETKHIPFYYAWRNDPEVAVFDQSEFIRPQGFDEISEWAQRLVSGYTYIVSVDDVYIGTIALMNVDPRNRHAELAIVIGEKSYWSKGHGTQMMEKLLEMGFEGLNLNRLYLHVFSFNTRAIKLYEKFNFKHEGTYRSMVYRNGQYHDVLAFGLMRDEHIA